MTSECDSLRKALELAQREVARAQKAQQDAEGRIATLGAHIHAQEVKLESMQRRLREKLEGVPSPGSDQEQRIELLENLCEQKEEENRQLRTHLAETAAQRAAARRQRSPG